VGIPLPLVPCLSYCNSKLIARTQEQQTAPIIAASLLSLSNKLLLYKTILKPIWTYGIQLCGTASTSNVEILERFQSKVLRLIVDAPLLVM
jgi:hypothetical protein